MQVTLTSAVAVAAAPSLAPRPPAPLATPCYAPSRGGTRQPQHGGAMDITPLKLGRPGRKLRADLAVGAMTGGGGASLDPPLDPASPAGRLAALEAAADSPLDALVFRKAASVARVMCEARLQQATAMGAMGLAASLAEAGVAGVEAKSGFALSSAEGGGTQAMAHMWVEVDGRVVDLLYNTMYIFEDARRAGFDLSEEAVVRAKVGDRMSPLMESILSSKRQLRLTVLGETVDIGPAAWPAAEGELGVTLVEEPPAGVAVAGMEEAGPMRRGFQDIIANDEVRTHWVDGMPAEYRRIFADLGGPNLLL